MCDLEIVQHSQYLFALSIVFVLHPSKSYKMGLCVLGGKIEQP